MTSPTLGQARKARANARPSWSKSTFAALAQQFLQNKFLAETLLFKNQGDKDHPGLRDDLLLQVRRHGDKDPETGSYVLNLDEPLLYGDEKVTKIKAEARGAGIKVLNIERAEALLTAKSAEDADGEDLVDLVTVQSISITDNLTHHQAAKVSALLEKLGVTYDTTTLFDEDKILALHVVDDVLTEAEVDGLYDKGDITWALKPLKK